MKSCFIFILLIFTASASISQEEKCEPNTCTTVAADRYKVELAGCTNFLDIYVLNSSGRPLRNIEIRGKVEFFYLDEAILDAKFEQYYNTNSLRAKIPSPGFYNCRITLTIDGSNIVVSFENECDLKAQIDSLKKTNTRKS
jgi:hypothetical protein